MAELPNAVGFRALQLRTILDAITRFSDAGRTVAEQAAAVHTTEAWRLGVELADAGLGASLYDLSSELLAALVDVTRDQVRGIWSELGTRLKGSVRRAVLGLDDPLQAMRSVARVIRDPKTFGTAFNRAEAIVRTEVNRTFSVAQQARLEQAVGAGVQAKKWWLTAEDSRVRPDHVDAGRHYSRDNAIPVDQPFIVGGEALMHPLDPRGSAAQTVNCRCVSVAAL